MVTRPAATTIEHVRVLFFQAHLARPGQKLRYFCVGGMPDFGRGCTSLQKQCAQIWYNHAHEMDTMAAVVFELRKGLTLAGVQHSDHELVDGVFAYAFDEALEKVRSTPGGAYAPPFVAPAYKRPADALASWHDRYAAFNQPEGGLTGAATRTSDSSFFTADQGDIMEWFNGDEDEQAGGQRSPDPYAEEGLDYE
jgi:hypothetical protein